MKVLIIRFSSIGDIVLTTPVIRCAATQTNAEVHFLTKNSFRSILENNHHLAKVYSIQSDVKEVLDDLKKENYDAVIDLHNNIRSRKVAASLQTKTVRFKKLNIQKWIWVNTKLNWMPKKHIVDRYFEAVNELGITNDFGGLDYFLPKDIQDIPSTHSLTKNEYIAISIGGTYPTKQMPLNVLIDIINRLKYTPVLLGGEHDIELGAEILAKVDRTIINLAGVTSLAESAFIIKHANAVLTGDTGMMHIASAFRKKTISVWGNTHPDLGMSPYILNNGTTDNQKIKIHQVDLKCRPCSKLGEQKCPRGHFNCMNLQNVEEIVQNCNSVVAAQ